MSIPVSQEDDWQTQVKAAAQRIRYRVLAHTIKNNGGYMSQACSTAELFATLYLHILNLGESQAPMIPPPFSGVPGKGNKNYLPGRLYHGPAAPHLDRFIFSPSHYSLVLYTALIEAGRMSPEGLEQFNQDGSTVEMIGAEHSPGIEVMGGSLGQALSQAAGIALARKRREETGRVFVLLSDGELQEGQTYEALQMMSFYRLDNMIVYVDVNGQCCDGRMTDVMNIEPIVPRLEGFGTRVFRVDGHDIEALDAPSELTPDGRPTIVLCDTNPTQGLPLLKERAPKLHYLRFQNEAEREKYRLELEKMAAVVAAAVEEE